MLALNRIYHIDALKGLQKLSDESVHCVVTSPPYWGLRDYGVKGQIGLEETPQAYVERIVEVFREVRRVLRRDGTLWLNLGDSYNGIGGPGKQDGGPIGPRAATAIAGTRGRRVSGLKPKDLVGIPWRVAFALQADGWYLRSDIIWAKPNPMPESVRDRPTKSHEYMFLFTRAQRYFYDAEAVKEASTERASGNKERFIARAGERSRRNTHLGSSIPYQPNGTGRSLRSVWQSATVRRCDASFASSPARIHEYVFLLTKSPRYFYDAEAVKEAVTGNAHARGSGVNPKARLIDAKRQRHRPRQNAGFSEAVTKLVDSRNLRSIWRIPTQPYPGAHFATFPEKLVEPCIKAGTSERGTCVECGAPLARNIQRNRVPTRDGENALTDPTGTAQPDPRRHLGWRPTCDCASEHLKPCVVLDPFIGAGTTAVVARRLGRHFIGFDLNEEYVQMARRRLRRLGATKVAA